MRYRPKLFHMDMGVPVDRRPRPKNDAKRGDPVSFSSGPLAIRNRTDRVLGVAGRTRAVVKLKDQIS